MNEPTKYSNQIDSIFVEPKEAIIAIENALGTNPQGPNHSTVSDRLNYLDKQLNSLSSLTDKDYLHTLNLATILSLGNTTDGYDIVLSTGDCISSADNSIYLKGNVIINGGLDLFDSLDLDGHKIKNMPDPVEQTDGSNKKYVDNQILAQNNKLTEAINNIKNNNGSSIQYTIGESQPFPPSESNKFLKRNIDNSNWEYVEIDLNSIYDKFKIIEKSIDNVSKNKTAGHDLVISIGDAIKSEEENGFVNIDSNVMIHKVLSMNDNIDMQSRHIINVADPIRKTDAINKQYHDNKIPTKLAIENQKLYSILYFDGKNWAALPMGEENDVLTIKNSMICWGKISINTNF